jgi:hypothetical protein
MKAWSAVVVLVPAVYAFACSTPVSNDVVESAATNLASDARIKSTAYLDQQANAWVSKTDWSFVQGGRCVMSCHTTAPFMLVRPQLPQTTGAASENALSVVRGLVENRVNNWATVAPLYSWVAPASRGTEAVLNAFALVSADVPTGAVSPVANKALSFMWKEQQTDGSFKWWDTFNLAPWENGEAGLWGAALADLTIGLTPASYVAAMSADEKSKLDRLESFLRTKAEDTARPLNNRAMILLASTRRPSLLPAATATKIADAMRALQASDGSWTAGSLGFAVAGGATAGTTAHAYATAFYTYVLGRTGDEKSATLGRGWLESHRRADGAWEAKSLNAPADEFNNQQITDAATAYAMMALTPSL